MKERFIEIIRDVPIAGKTYEEYVEAVAEKLIDEGCECLEKYKEILELHKYCEKTGVECRLEKLYDGYALRFNNGGDFVQHKGSYGCDVGCVEPAIECRLDYSAVPLKNAIELVRRHKDRLNKALKGANNEQRKAD
jgi:hypothetical protein